MLNLLIPVKDSLTPAEIAFLVKRGYFSKDLIPVGFFDFKKDDTSVFHQVIHKEPSILELDFISENLDNISFLEKVFSPKSLAQPWRRANSSEEALYHIFRKLPATLAFSQKIASFIEHKVVRDEFFYDYSSLINYRETLFKVAVKHFGSSLSGGVHFNAILLSSLANKDYWFQDLLKSMVKDNRIKNIFKELLIYFSPKVVKALESCLEDESPSSSVPLNFQELKKEGLYGLISKLKLDESVDFWALLTDRIKNPSLSQFEKSFFSKKLAQEDTSSWSPSQKEDFYKFCLLTEFKLPSEFKQKNKSICFKFFKETQEPFRFQFLPYRLEKNDVFELKDHFDLAAENYGIDNSVVSSFKINDINWQFSLRELLQFLKTKDPQYIVSWKIFQNNQKTGFKTALESILKAKTGSNKPLNTLALTLTIKDLLRSSVKSFSSQEIHQFYCENVLKVQSFKGTFDAKDATSNRDLLAQFVEKRGFKVNPKIKSCPVFCNESPFDIKGFSWPTYEKTATKLGLTPYFSKGNSQYKIDCLLSLKKLVFIFGSDEAFIQKLLKISENNLKKSLKVVHDLGSDVSISVTNPSWSKDKWVPLLKAHPELLAHSSLFSSYEKSKGVPRTKVEFISNLSEFKLKEADPLYSKFASYCLELDLDKEEYSKAKATLRRLKPKESCDLALDDFVQDHYKAHVLKPGDFRALLIGIETGCCQHIVDGFASNCAQFSYSSSEGGVFVIDNLKTGKTLAQSFIWKGDCEEKTLVIDSVESIFCRKSAPLIAKIYSKAIEQWLLKGFKVYFSSASCGLTSEVLRLLKKDSLFKISQKATPKRPAKKEDIRLTYTDAGTYCSLIEANK